MQEEGGQDHETEKLQEFALPVLQRARPERIHELGAENRERGLTVLLVRGMSGQFSRRHHVAVEAVHYYWHFVDVVWIVLFLTIYVIK